MSEAKLPHHDLTCQELSQLYELPTILKGVRLQIGLEEGLEDREVFVRAFRKYKPDADLRTIHNHYECCLNGADVPLEVGRWFMALPEQVRKNLLFNQA